ncbi:hypothetical protein LV75_003832 [Actinokineospora diospyrosa]|uniref:Uncharacterized protein n=1 Tax=Actinokineospora diospyrosa TaxID=103728 RepID=A0ABT1IF93_9PSEU|nr:hypothetical protein [Actinokineospora diospyrosa]
MLATHPLTSDAVTTALPHPHAAQRPRAPHLPSHHPIQPSHSAAGHPATSTHDTPHRTTSTPTHHTNIQRQPPDQPAIALQPPRPAYKRHVTDHPATSHQPPEAGAPSHALGPTAQATLTPQPQAGINPKATSQPATSSRLASCAFAHQATGSAMPFDPAEAGAAGKAVGRRYPTNTQAELASRRHLGIQQTTGDPVMPSQLFRPDGAHQATGRPALPPQHFGAGVPSRAVGHPGASRPWGFAESPQRPGYPLVPRVGHPLEVTDLPITPFQIVPPPTSARQAPGHSATSHQVRPGQGIPAHLPRQAPLGWDPHVDNHQRLIDFLAGVDPQEVPSWRAG